MTSKPGMVSKSYRSDYMQSSFFAIVSDPAQPALSRYYITTPLFEDSRVPWYAWSQFPKNKLTTNSYDPKSVFKDRITPPTE